jgi:hypothetical protein
VARVATDYTIDELVSVCIARQMTDGDILTSRGNGYAAGYGGLFVG